MELKQGYKQTEVGVIPEDWNVKSLGELGEFKNGINKSAEDFGFGSPFVNLMDVFGKYEINNNTSLDLINSNSFEKKTYNLKKGDVLFIRSSVKPSGVGLTALIKEDIIDTVYSGFLIRFREKSYLEDSYKKYCFYSERFRLELIANSTVSANTNINQEALKKLKIGFPTNKPEQTAIANALSDMDALISQTEKLIEKKKAIKQGAMQELLKPKEGWVNCTLGDIINLIADYTANGSFESLKNNVKYYSDSNYAVLVRTTDLDKNKFVPERFTDKLGYDFLSKTSLSGGEIVIANVGSLGKVFRVPHFEMPMTLAPNTYLLKFSNTIDENFIFYWLNTKEFYQKLMSKIGSTTLQAINKDNLRSIELSVPNNIEDQIKISKILTDIDSERKIIENKLTKLKQQKQGMMQALLTGKIRLVS